ncbi:class E sortase [Candidatus Dojkabacteria bacterium]|nr:class E sortase [Candidatus Dojkabacteria bacterium]
MTKNKTNHKKSKSVPINQGSDTLDLDFPKTQSQKVSDIIKTIKKDVDSRKSKNSIGDKIDGEGSKTSNKKSKNKKYSSSVEKSSVQKETKGKSSKKSDKAKKSNKNRSKLIVPEKYGIKNSKSLKAGSGHKETIQGKSTDIDEIDRDDAKSKTKSNVSSKSDVSDGRDSSESMPNKDKTKQGKIARDTQNSRVREIITRVVSLGLFILSLFLILMPFLPNIAFWIQKNMGAFDYDSQDFSSNNIDNDDGDEVDATSTGNKIYIPVIGLDANIVEGQTEDALLLGAWRRPNSSTPDKGGNTVITGHRFQYLPPNNLTFYHLDKVQVGDEIVIFWEGKRYEYIVIETKVVEPTDTYVEDQTEEPRLTLYTCTPLFTANQRLVVVAEPKVEEEAE